MVPTVTMGVLWGSYGGPMVDHWRMAIPPGDGFCLHGAPEFLHFRGRHRKLPGRENHWRKQEESIEIYCPLAKKNPDMAIKVLR